MTGGTWRRGVGLGVALTALFHSGLGATSTDPSGPDQPQTPAPAATRSDPGPCRPDPLQNGDALAQTVDAANGSPDEAVIVLSPGCIYALRSTLVIRARLDANQQPVPLTIEGHDAVIERPRVPDPNAPSGDGSSDFRIFDVEAQAVLVVEAVEIRGGRARSDDGGGGGIRVASLARLTLRRLTLTRNWSGEGSALANFGDAEVVDSTIAANRSGARGSVVWNVGRLRLAGSTVSGNRGDGGATIRNNGFTEVVRSTLSGNVAYARVVENNAQLMVAASTIAANEGVAVLDRSEAAVFSSVLADNTGVNCAGDAVSTQRILSTDASCNGVISSVTLGSLRHNGGPTRTMALRHGSSGVDPGPCELGSGYAASDLAADQRGVTRDDRCDIGAFERIDEDRDGYDDLTEMP